MATQNELINTLKFDWMPSDYYNFEDLNRVEEATEIVKDAIALYRGIDIQMENKITDRSLGHLEFADSLNRIESNIDKLKKTFPKANIFENSKLDWTFNTPFDFNDANRLEKNLFLMYEIIEKNMSYIPYCGQYTTGEKGVY